MGELALMLRPAGGGIHMVSSGRAGQEDLQRRLYGVASSDGVDAAWRAELARVAAARVAILAIPSDTGAGLVRGAAFGPGALRAAVLDLLPDFPARARRAGIVDVGDVFVVPQLLSDDMLSDAQRDATRAAIYGGVPGVGADLMARLPVSPLSMAADVVGRLLALNPDLKVFVLGGDHSVAWPVVSALAAHRKRPFAIVHPDAHTDLLPERLGVKVCFATWAYHANDLIGRGGRLVQVGVRASRHPREHWESTLGVRQFWADDIARRGEAGALDDILAHLRAVGAGDVYLSNDIDGTDAAAAPATGAPEGGGLSVAFVRALIGRLAREVSLIGADLVEVAPTIGAPEAARKTVDVGARYVLDSLAALSAAKELVI
ncbi:MAG: arginase family protein [Pseudomonadota bacterium]